ncbi:TetR/AcrR family transcriptional regulator [bacterium SCSIO 12741]|nr:TetR/AcrR family transcriptional regulator [bacterium SCSIO 12741]
MKKAEATRKMILQKAFELIYAKGYQTTSIDDIIATTQVTKGAFYYHFKNKDAMGLAIIQEILKPALSGSFKQILDENENPMESIYQLMHMLLLENEFLKAEYGCPASNFTQEMSPWNNKFNTVLSQLNDQWNQSMVDAINRGKEKGFIRLDVNAAQVTRFVISGYWGIRIFGKLEDSKKAYSSYLEELKNYLQGLQ